MQLSRNQFLLDVLRGGGVLSPFLRNILVDDILRLSLDFPVHFIAYADNITIVTSHKDPAMATRYLQIVCDAVGVWLNSRELSLNALKTVFVLFSRNALPGRTIVLTLMA
jgi:hypothetical protein